MSELKEGAKMDLQALIGRLAVRALAEDLRITFSKDSEIKVFKIEFGYYDGVKWHYIARADRDLGELVDDCSNEFGFIVLKLKKKKK